MSVCKGSYDGYFRSKINRPSCEAWDSQGNKKYKFYLYCSGADCLIRNENIALEEHKIENRLKISYS